MITIPTKPQTPDTETVLWGVKKGEPDYAEEVLYQCKGYTNLQDLATKGEQWAEENGYDRLRIAVLDLKEKPNFQQAVNQ